MAFSHYYLTLLLLSFSLLLSLHSAQSQLSPDGSPAATPSLGATTAPTQSPGPTSPNYVSFPPLIAEPLSISEAPSEALSPNAEPLSESEGSSGFGISTMMAGYMSIDPRVKEICDSTDYPSLCLATVAPFLDGKTDVSSVLQVAIEAGAKLTKYALSMAKNYAERPGTPPALASVPNGT